MMAALLTLALLPLALTACPCPPAPAAATVCGRDNKTYPSACDLDCTAPPGVAAAHPGPCHPEDAAPSRPISAALLSRHRARRSASEEYKEYRKCEEDRKCQSLTCSECESEDWRCWGMCQRNCKCSCLGLQTSGLNHSPWAQCFTERDCNGKHGACNDRCSTEECWDRCWMDAMWCECGCMEQEQAATTPRPTSTSPATTSPASTSRATTSPASTSPASTSPDTTSPATTSPASTSPDTTSPATTSPATTSPAIVWERVLLVVCALACVCVCVWVSERARARHPVLCCPKNVHIVYQLAGSEQCQGAAARASTTTAVELKSLELNCGPPP